MSDDNIGGSVFTATLVTSALSTAGPHDLIGLLASSASRLQLLRTEMVALSTSPGALSAQLELIRGSTGVFAGSAITPVNQDGWPTAKVATAAAAANSASLVSTASASRLEAGGFSGDNVYCYDPCVKPIVVLNQRVHWRIGTPNAATAIAITVSWREQGAIPG